MKPPRYLFVSVVFGLASVLALSGCSGGGGGGGDSDIVLVGPGPGPDFPDVRGVYRGGGTSTNTDCVVAMNNGTIRFTIRVEVPFQDEALVRMTLRGDTIFGPFTFRMDPEIDVDGAWRLIEPDVQLAFVSEGLFAGDTVTGSVLFPKTQTNLCNTFQEFTATR